MNHWYRVTFGRNSVWVYCVLEDRFGKAYQQAKQLGYV
jgi:hypothetical protein